MTAAAMVAYGRPSSTAAAAAVRAYMLKVEGSMAVEAANRPLLTQRKRSREWATAGRHRRATALRTRGPDGAGRAGFQQQENAASVSPEIILKAHEGGSGAGLAAPCISTCLHTDTTPNTPTCTARPRWLQRPVQAPP